jgi:tripartite-type tricarboxylate transporter receptor subunit TctC
MRRLFVLLALLSTSFIVEAQNDKPWPRETIRIVVSFTPGGAPDTLARILAEDWQKTLGIPIVVENRPGHGGNIGADLVAKSNPDGYTLLIGTVGIHAINGALYEKLSYDPIADFTPISFLASTPNVLIVSKQLGVQSLKDLIALAKAKPNELTFGSSGTGTSIHMSGELFKDLAGVQIRHIPYKGRAQSLPDLVSGRISMLFDNLASALPLIRANEVTALGVTTLKRSPSAPDIPTLAEQGLKGFEAISWFSLMAPAKLPKDIQGWLNQLTIQTLSKPEIRLRLMNGGLQPNPGSPEELSRYIQQEATKWRKIVQQSGAKEQ